MSRQEWDTTLDALGRVVEDQPQQWPTWARCLVIAGAIAAGAYVPTLVLVAVRLITP